MVRGPGTQMDSPLKFDNRFVHALPCDPSDAPHSRPVLHACYSRVQPVRPSQPELVSVAWDVAEMLELDPAWVKSSTFVQAFSGHTLLEGMEPFAMCYGGHQFGHWAGQLGDGRAINLGELVTSQGDHWMLQLKGAGPTPYSRHADGFAVLRSSVREFLCSEAMHHLGIPTTRALSLVKTGDAVVRDMFYDGRPMREPGAIVCRVAPTFVRFGNFEIFAARQDTTTLSLLVDHVLRSDFPHLGQPNSDSRERWFEEVCRRTAVMITHWMRVGFVHGVMNTDNMSILGQTIDYGPYGWLEGYDPSWTPNTTDAEGRRYCYGQQPQIAYWNLAQLANALRSIMEGEDWGHRGLQAYVSELQTRWYAMVSEKLGIGAWKQETDEPILDRLLELLRSAEIDMTWFYRLLADYPVKDATEAESTIDPSAVLKHFAYAYYRDEEKDEAAARRIADWIALYAERVRSEGIPDAVRRERMNRVNPKFVLRNYLAQQAIDAAEQGDYSEIDRLLQVLRFPYDEQPGKERFAERRPEWARHRAGCSMLSCSS